MLDKQKDLATQVVIVRYLLLECIHNNYLSQNLFLESGMYPIYAKKLNFMISFLRPEIS